MRAFRYYLIGSMLNNIFPVRMGDLGRADLLGREEEVRRVYGLSTIMVEGAIGALSLLPLLLLALIFFPLPAFLLQAIAVFFGAVRSLPDPFTGLPMA